MTHPDDTPQEGEIAKLIDEQLALAASRLPALAPEAVHPSPADHDEIRAPHPDFEDVMLGKARPSAEMLDELAALDAAPALSDDELARQALEAPGADGNAATPE